MADVAIRRRVRLGRLPAQSREEVFAGRLFDVYYPLARMFRLATSCEYLSPALFRWTGTHILGGSCWTDTGVDFKQRCHTEALQHRRRLCGRLLYHHLLFVVCVSSGKPRVGFRRRREIRKREAVTSRGRQRSGFSQTRILLCRIILSVKTAVKRQR